MSFWKWMDQQADESKIDLLLIGSGFALVGHASLPAAFGAIILVLGVEYYSYRKSSNEDEVEPVANEGEIAHRYTSEGEEVMTLPKSGVMIDEQDETVNITLDESTSKTLQNKSFKSSVEELKNQIRETEGDA